MSLLQQNLYEFFSEKSCFKKLIPLPVFLFKTWLTVLGQKSLGQISSFQKIWESRPMGPISISWEAFLEGGFNFGLIVSVLVGHFVQC